MNVRAGNGKSASDENGRVISLDAERIGCASVVGYSHYLSVSKCAEFHVHPGCVELILCLRGNCTYSTPEGDYTLKAGCVMVSRSAQPHMLKVYHKGLRTYWIHFRLPRPGSPILGLPKRESDWLAKRLVNLPQRVFRGAEALRRGFSRLFEVYDTVPRKSAARSVQLRAAVLEILMATLACSESVPNAPSRRIVARLIDAMRTHPDRTYPLEGLAEQAEMSVSNLMTSFKRQTGLSPHAFLLSCRMEMAKRLLAEGKSVSAVADATGFSSQKRLSTYFRQAEGCSPREWLASQK